MWSGQLIGRRSKRESDKKLKLKKRINICNVLRIRPVENMDIGWMLQNLNLIRASKFVFLELGLFIKSWWKTLKKNDEEKEREKRF